MTSPTRENLQTGNIQAHEDTHLLGDGLSGSSVQAMNCGVLLGRSGWMLAILGAQTAFAAAYGATGSVILAKHGCDSCSVREAAEKAALGSAALLVSLMLMVVPYMTCQMIRGKAVAHLPPFDPARLAVFTIAGGVVGSMVGHGLFSEILGGPGDMSLKKTVEASAIGSGIIAVSLLSCCAKK